ncbi:MAG: sulfite exporter TauE/SafE family protein [Austwickia sp.]|nr:sulfite exporter TauE/SafE family protein [Actinomycetota bacterium]MCO5308897.1 sulfite exporter TauE/SafE family protein [Austwickia sp.]
MGQLLAIVPLGLLVGVVLGALGGGGAILTVPILVYVLGQRPAAATAGSLVIVSLTALAGMASHARKGNVRWRDGLIFGAVGVVGSLIGSRLSTAVSGPVLLTAFGVMMIGVGILMLRRRARGGNAVADGERRGVGVLAATATGVGFLTGFFGVGGGFAVVPALVLALGFSMPVAVGTSLLVIIVNSIVALGARAAGGLAIDWPVILVFSAFGAIGSILGGRIAARVDPRQLSLAFSILLFAVAAYVLAMNIPQLR